MAWLDGLRKLLTKRRPVHQRLLTVYDCSTQPFSIGDILVCQEASLVLRERAQLEYVDLALVYDPRQPGKADPSFASVTESNVVYHLASILPAAQVNPYLGSVLIFNSHRHLQRFIADNADLYQVWPNNWEPSCKEYLYYHVFNDVVYPYYRLHGIIPYLSCRDFLRQWAQAFFTENVAPRVPVTVQLRNNRRFHRHRNTCPESWLSFFEHCQARYPVGFVVVCGRDEVDERFRDLPNVVIAKDHGTSLEQDLALIHSAALHMGASSGPGTMAIFSPRPYLLVNIDIQPALYRGLIHENGFYRFGFASPGQRVAVGQESPELLIAQFARMWESVERSGRHPEATHTADLLTWMR